ncbi:MAG: phosphotransferase [Chloroflexota bacterium]|nr:phosphotransferase [Chloroflexota bacterium]
MRPPERPLASTATFTRDWLVRQRWFRAKRRLVATVVEADRASLGGGAWLLVLAVRYADGGEDRYLVPAIEDDARWREPRDGDGAWRAIVRLISEGAEIPARAGRFRFAATPALAGLLPPVARAGEGLEERRLAVEQTNTSVVLSDRLILKVYRLLEGGENPDLEVSAFLTEVGFAATPALAGAGHFVPVDGAAPLATAMLQAFVPSRGDAWAYMLGCLATDLEAATTAAARIGEVTSALHRALASRPEHPSFPARPATVEEAAAWRAGAERELADAEASLSGAQRERLVRLAPPIRAMFADAFGSASASAPVTRIHGDYHLGQLLVTVEGGFMVIDFEGEPARPLVERRRPSSPLRDVAGMLRSLDYAARTAERGARATGFHVDSWLAAARSAFLNAYDATSPDEGLLRAFELEKACYEVRYEANNRPAWIWLPLEALERLAR